MLVLTDLLSGRMGRGGRALLVLGGMALAGAGLALSGIRSHEVACPLVSVWFDAADAGTLIVRVCATLPPIGPGIVIRCDGELRLTIMPTLRAPMDERLPRQPEAEPSPLANRAVQTEIAA